MFPIGGISRATFLRDYWRRKPLFVKGGARELGVSLSEDDYRVAAADLEARHPDLVRRGPDGLLACQNISSVEPTLGRWLAGVMREMSWPTAWMDAVYAESDSGIGGHFDDSDNFILQQSGTKIWRLQDRAELDQDQLALAMQRTGVADSMLAMHEAENLLEFRLEAGDLLYVPLLWGHWGVSEGRSLSISLVSNAENALAIMPLLHWAVADLREWWDALPVPQVVDFGPGAEDDVPAEVTATFTELLASLSAPEQVRAISGLWWSARIGKLREIDRALNTSGTSS